MEGFEKINLDTGKIPQASPKEKSTIDTMRSKKYKKNKIFLITAIIVIVIVAFFVFGVIFPGIKLVADAKKMNVQAKTVLTDVKQQNVALASDDLNKTRDQLLQTQSDLAHMVYLKYIPLLSWYYNDGDHLIKAALYGLDGGRTLIDAVSPYADVLGLKGQSSFTGGSAQQRIQTAVTTLSKITPDLDKISVSLGHVKEELDQVNPNHYPSLFGGNKIKQQLSEARTITDQADLFVTQASPLIKVIPNLLGEPDEKKYMILFQNNYEQRPTAGFITAYAILRFEHGVPHPDSSDDIYSLDATIANKPVAPRPLQLYLPKVPEFNLRDTNLSPDFVTSMNTFNSLYDKAGGYKKVDGIIGIDTYPLVAAINILGGEINVDGTNFTTKTDPRCNCPQVIYQLEASADQPVNYVRSGRKGVIGDLMLAIMTKALSSSPKLYWAPLFRQC